MYVLLTQLVVSVSLVVGVNMIEANRPSFFWSDKSLEAALELTEMPYKNQDDFNDSLTIVLDLWDSERPGLVKGIKAIDLVRLLASENREVRQAPEDPSERADVIIFCNRLMKVLGPECELYGKVKERQLDHLNWMVKKSLNPQQVVGEKIKTNYWNYPPAMFGKDGVERNLASMHVLRCLRDENGNLEKLLPIEEEDEFCVWRMVGLELAGYDRESES